MSHRILSRFLSVDDCSYLVSELLPATPAEHWQAGRQGTGYEKLPLRPETRPDEDGPRLPARLEALLQRSLEALGVDIIDWDAYILRYTKGTHVPEHTDPTAAHPHLRLNGIITAPTRGGELYLAGQLVTLEVGDAVVFRPDVVPHHVTAVDSMRLVWSVGCIYSESR